MFTENEHCLAEAHGVTASAFRYSSGVEALRIKTARVELIALPFRGQQIWRYFVDGENLTMVSRFHEPARSRVFGDTYGAFLLHCGLSGLGAPASEDTHPHHGELPNAEYDEANLTIGDDWVALSGTCRLRTSHSMDVSFTPTLTLQANDTLLRLEASITNHRSTPFGYSYWCHANWPLFDNGELLQSAALQDDNFILVPHHAQDEATAEYTRAIELDPSAGTALTLARTVTPEYCAVIRPHADAEGQAHFAMTRSDGSAATVSFGVDALPYAIRWISNTGDEQAAGFCLPATAHHLGRAAAERDGMVRSLASGETTTFTVTLGLMDPPEAASMTARINSLNRTYSEYPGVL